MSGQVDGLDGQVEGCMGRWMDEWADGWFIGCMGGWMDGQTVRWIGGQAEGCMDGWVDGWTGRWLDRWLAANFSQASVEREGCSPASSTAPGLPWAQPCLPWPHQTQPSCWGCPEEEEEAAGGGSSAGPAPAVGSPACHGEGKFWEKETFLLLDVSHGRALPLRRRCYFWVVALCRGGTL